MKFTVIEDIDAQKIWASDVWTESDWPIVFLLRLMYTEHWNQEWADANGPYHMEIHAVSPQAAGKENRASAIRSVGMKFVDYNKLTIQYKSLVLMEYGVSAPLWQKSGDDEKILEELARKEMKFINIMFGFRMDWPVNAIGNTGWDAIKGQIGFRREPSRDTARSADPGPASQA